MVVRSPISARALITLKSKNMWWMEKKQYAWVLHQDLLLQLYIAEVLRWFGFICNKITVKRSFNDLYCYVVVVRKPLKRFLSSEDNDFKGFNKKKWQKIDRSSLIDGFNQEQIVDNGDFEFEPEEPGFLADDFLNSIDLDLLNTSNVKWLKEVVGLNLTSAGLNEYAKVSVDEYSTIEIPHVVGSHFLHKSPNFEDSKLFKRKILEHDYLKESLRKRLEAVHKRYVEVYWKFCRAKWRRLKLRRDVQVKAISKQLWLIRRDSWLFKMSFFRLSLEELKKTLSVLSGGMNVKLFFVNGLVLSWAILADGQQFELWDSFDYWHWTKGFARLFFSTQIAFFGFSAAVLAECLARLLFRERRQTYLVSCINSLVLFFWSHAKYVRGIKIILTGRIDGRDRAQQKVIKYGKVPVNTLSVYVDYAALSFYNIRGAFGLRVFITHGLDFKPDVIA